MSIGQTLPKCHDERANTDVVRNLRSLDFEVTNVCFFNSLHTSRTHNSSPDPTALAPALGSGVPPPIITSPWNFASEKPSGTPGRKLARPTRGERVVIACSARKRARSHRRSPWRPNDVRRRRLHDDTRYSLVVLQTHSWSGVLTTIAKARVRSTGECV